MAVVKISASEVNLGSNEMKAVDVEGESVLLVNLDGTMYAIGNKCTHRNCKLSSGVLKDGTVKCGCHNSVFDVKTGNVLKGPAKKPVQKYEVTVEDGEIKISV
ncbi:MAG: Rieske 2Fe-2S domain-containing protein [Candidatus Bathyarchaeota archaeon]|nr:Rieske 2Fe-2S domain-containing protein [Candidatus Bathyarchaeota archaeon]